jgi:hypothetical protein
MNRIADLSVPQHMQEEIESGREKEWLAGSAMGWA